MEKTVKTLVPGEVLLVEAKMVGGEKVQLEFASIIKNPNAKGGNALTSMLNKSDDRFSSNARRGWISGVKSDIEELLGLDLSSLQAKNDVQPINKLNPEINGERVNIQIEETTTPDDYQRAKVTITAKRAGKDGDFIKHNGKHIFSNSSVVIGTPVHTFLTADVVGTEVTAAAPVAAQELQA